LSDPIHVQYTQVNGHRIAYRELGEGDPVVLIHGIPTSSLLWRDVMPALAAKHRVIAPDLLNYGESDKPTDANVSIEAQSRIVVGLMQTLGLRAADIVSHDIGGGVAQIIAVNHPERVRKLVLIDSVCFDSWPIPEFKPLQEEGAEDKMSFDEFLKMMRAFMPQGVHDKSALAERTIEMILAPWASEEGKRALFRNFRRLNPEYTQAVAGELKHLRHPTLVMWATGDVFQKPHYAERLAETIPNAKLVWIEQAGHWLMEEKPDAVARELMRFLDD
jgi:2-hydroxymuconate-semialdehyde hydrolase